MLFCSAVIAFLPFPPHILTHVLYPAVLAIGPVLTLVSVVAAAALVAAFGAVESDFVVLFWFWLFVAYRHRTRTVRAHKRAPRA